MNGSQRKSSPNAVQPWFSASPWTSCQVKRENNLVWQFFFQHSFKSHSRIQFADSIMGKLAFQFLFLFLSFQTGTKLTKFQENMSDETLGHFYISILVGRVCLKNHVFFLLSDYKIFFWLTKKKKKKSTLIFRFGRNLRHPNEASKKSEQKIYL